MIFKDYNLYKNKCGAYRIYNTINKTSYIGATYDCFNNRFVSHKSQLRLNKHSNSKLKEDYNKYDSDSFIFEVLFCSDDINDIKNKEKECIELYSKDNGVYNKHTGGENVGNKISKETRSKMSVSHKGSKLSEYQKNILAEYNKNRKVSEEQKRILSEKYQGSNSSFAILNEEKVAEIQALIISNYKDEYIANLYGVKKTCISNIRLGYRWKHVEIDGWKEYQCSRLKHHICNEEIELDVIDMISSGCNNASVHTKYGFSYGKIKNIRKKI